MKNIFIILLLLFSTSIFAQNVFNEAVSGTIAMDGTWKAKYIGKGYKTIIVVNKSAYTLSVAFQKDGKRDTSNAITWIKSGSTPIFSSQICDSMFFKADGDSVQYTVMYGQGVGFNYVGVDNLPDSIIIRSTYPLNTKPIHYVDTVSYNNILDVSTTSATYEFGSQYSNVKLIGMSDTAIAGGDTLRAYNIGYRGDTTDIYFLDSANNRILYVVSSGDCKYKEYRLDILCPEYVMFKFNDSPIYTTKWYLIPKAYKK